MMQDGDESWTELASMLYHLVTVTYLHIGSCPIAFVHAVADSMFWLLHFSADNIADSQSQLDRFPNVFFC